MWGRYDKCMKQIASLRNVLLVLVLTSVNGDLERD